MMWFLLTPLVCPSWLLQAQLRAGLPATFDIRKKADSLYFEHLAHGARSTFDERVGRSPHLYDVDTQRRRLRLIDIQVVE